MPHSNELQALSVQELRAELERRQVSLQELSSIVPSRRCLAGFDSASIVAVLSDKQKAIYGADHRVDLFQLDDAESLADADCVAAGFRTKNVVDNGDGTSTLVTVELGIKHGLCTSELFWDQPAGAYCSAFLVAPDVIATAGHCVDSDNLPYLAFVFGFHMLDAATARVVVANREIYRGIEVIERREVATGPDWALVLLDRPVVDHRIARCRRRGRIPDGQAVHVIGHPCGLPAKFAAGARVRDNRAGSFFVANLDTFGGNSGSPVFNSLTHEVEGILARGERDFVQRGDCNVSLVCPTTGCRGEDCTRTTEFAQLL